MFVRLREPVAMPLPVLILAGCLLLGLSATARPDTPPPGREPDPPAAAPVTGPPVQPREGQPPPSQEPRRVWDGALEMFISPSVERRSAGGLASASLVAFRDSRDNQLDFQVGLTVIHRGAVATDAPLARMTQGPGRALPIGRQDRRALTCQFDVCTYADSVSGLLFEDQLRSAAIGGLQVQVVMPDASVVALEFPAGLARAVAMALDAAVAAPTPLPPGTILTRSGIHRFDFPDAAGRGSVALRLDNGQLIASVSLIYPAMGLREYRRAEDALAGALSLTVRSRQGGLCNPACVQNEFVYVALPPSVSMPAEQSGFRFRLVPREGPALEVEVPAALFQQMAPAMAAAGRLPG